MLLKNFALLSGVLMLTPIAFSAGWGDEAAVVKPPRALRQRVKTQPAAPPIVVAETAPPPAPVVAAPPPAEPAAAKPSLLKFAGFADLRYTSCTSEGNRSVANPHAESGFGLEDGAIYLNYENQKVGIVGDIAFRRAKDGDVNPSAVPNQSSNANIAFGNDKSQIYLRYNLSEGLNFNFGQFDTIYGVELNDSKDRVFGKTGLVYDATLPVTHTGLIVDYSRNGFTGKIFSANPNNKGTTGSSAAGDENSEYGAAVSYGNETVRAQIGYMTRPISKADASELSGRNLLDITAGFTLGSFAMDFEFASVDDPSKNTLTALDNTDRESAGTGLLALPTYKVSDAVLLGLRFEQLQNDPAGAGVKSAEAFGVSAHYKLAADCELRAEYTGYNFKDTADVKWKDSRASLAAVLTL